MRYLYASLIRLHPPAFRQQFAQEMLWIFEEAEDAWGSGFPLPRRDSLAVAALAHSLRSLEMGGSRVGRGRPSGDCVRKFLAVGPAVPSLTVYLVLK